MSDIKKIEKISLKEIGVQDLDVKEIYGFDKISVKSTDIIDDLMLRSESLNSFYEPLIDYNGKYDRKANQFTSDAKKKYISADKSFYNKTKKNNLHVNASAELGERAETCAAPMPVRKDGRRPPNFLF